MANIEDKCTYWVLNQFLASDNLQKNVDEKLSSFRLQAVHMDGIRRDTKGYGGDITQKPRIIAQLILML